MISFRQFDMMSSILLAGIAVILLFEQELFSTAWFAIATVLVWIVRYEMAATVLAGYMDEK